MDIMDWNVNSPVIQFTAIVFGIQWVAFIFALYWRTEKFYDAIGSFTFILITYLNYNWNGTGHLREETLSFMVIAWAIRLGSFLIIRILKIGKDRRFNDIICSPTKFFSIWCLQGFWIIVTLMPIILCVNNRQQIPIGLRDYFGWSVWIIGFFIEVVSDYQKAIFRNNLNNKDKFISSGLWSISRHPNYFGEILLWFGLYISSSSGFHSIQYFSVLCPLFNYFLITRISGIPPLELYGIKKWGKLPQYREYLKITPILIPYIG